MWNLRCSNTITRVQRISNGSLVGSSAPENDRLCTVSHGQFTEYKFWRPALDISSKPGPWGEVWRVGACKNLRISLLFERVAVCGPVFPPVCPPVHPSQRRGARPGGALTIYRGREGGDDARAAQAARITQSASLSRRGQGSTGGGWVGGGGDYAQPPQASPVECPDLPGAPATKVS